MTEDVIEESVEVISSCQRIYSKTINNTSDSDVNDVIVRIATKSYGSGRKKCDVLQGFNMTVQKGKM